MNDKSGEKTERDKRPTINVEWFIILCWLICRFVYWGPVVILSFLVAAVKTLWRLEESFETDWTNFKTKGLMRLTVIDWEKVDDR